MDTKKMRKRVLSDRNHDLNQDINKGLNKFEYDIYFVPRKNYFMGKLIKHSGWYPNYRQPQLFKKGAMSYTMDLVHEGYINNSKIKTKEVQK